MLLKRQGVGWRVIGGHHEPTDLWAMHQTNTEEMKMNRLSKHFSVVACFPWSLAGSSRKKWTEWVPIFCKSIFADDSGSTGDLFATMCWWSLLTLQAWICFVLQGPPSFQAKITHYTKGSGLCLELESISKIQVWSATQTRRYGKGPHPSLFW